MYGSEPLELVDERPTETLENENADDDDNDGRRKGHTMDRCRRVTCMTFTSGEEAKENDEDDEEYGCHNT